MSIGQQFPSEWRSHTDPLSGVTVEQLTNHKGHSHHFYFTRHGSSMRIQQTHVHPRFSPDGSYVVYTSDVSGYGNLYRVAVAAFESLPDVND